MQSRSITNRSYTTTQPMNGRAIWLLYALILVVFSAIAAALLLNRYQSVNALAQERLSQLASIHDENLLLQMRNIESLARSTAEELRDSPDDVAHLQTYVDNIAQQLSALRTIAVINSNGIIIADSRPERPGLGIDVGDRAYFTVHAEQQNNMFFVDDAVFSRANATWSLPMTLGVWDNDDRFLGVIIASLEPVHLSTTIGNFGEDDIEGFIAKDTGSILTSLPYSVDNIGMILPYNTLMGDDILSTESEFIAHRHVEEYNLRVVFVQQRADILQPFYREVILTGVIILALSVVTFVGVRNYLVQAGRVQQSERELRTLTDNISDFVALLDRDLRHLYVNPALLKSTGLTLQDYIGKTNAELNMPEAQVTFWDTEMRQVIETKQGRDIEFRFTTVDGERWLQAKLTPEFDETNEVHAVLSVVRDITDLKDAQQALVERTQTLTLSLQAAGAGVWVWDLATGEIAWDETIERIHGLTPGSFPGTYEAWRAGVHPDDLPEAEAALNQSIETRTTWEQEFRIIRPDGTQRHLLAQAIIITDPETDHAIRVIGVNIDITDRIEAEAKRLEAERTRIEVEEQRKIIDLKERFIATASHDFRTPLTIIQSSVGMLQRYDDRFTGEKRQDKLTGIQEQVAHMTHLLDDVLTISKSHANKMALMPRTIDLQPFCHDIWDSIVTLDDGVHLKEFSYNTTVEQIKADPHLLRQAFENLLSNALKYTPPGKLVKFEVLDIPEGLCFNIIDNGYGIPESDQKHLFEPFYRARNVNNIQGTGLGLAIAYEFIQLHNGTIDVESTEGSGTTFTVILPV